MQKTQKQIKQNKKQAVSGGVVAGIIVAAVLTFIFMSAGAIGTVSWYNRPAKRIDRAIRRNDIETVTELYGELKTEEDELSVQQRMVSLAEELKDDYLRGERDYDELMYTYDLLNEEILAWDDDFIKLKRLVENVEDSREAYEEAEELFDKEDYAGARKKYMLVIEDDDLNYANACKAIEECEKKIADKIVSTWTVEYDFGEILEYDSYYYGDSYSLPAKIIFDFRENGMSSMSVEIVNKDMWVEEFADYYTSLFEEYYGVSGDELDEYLEYMGYESMDEWIEEDIVYIENECDTFEYFYDGSILSVWLDDTSYGEEIVADIEDDTMTLTNSSDGWNYWYDMGLNLPLVLTRDNAEL